MVYSKEKKKSKHKEEQKMKFHAFFNSLKIDGLIGMTLTLLRISEVETRVCMAEDDTYCFSTYYAISLFQSFISAWLHTSYFAKQLNATLLSWFVLVGFVQAWLTFTLYQHVLKPALDSPRDKFAMLSISILLSVMITTPLRLNVLEKTPTVLKPHPSSL